MSSVFAAQLPLIEPDRTVAAPQGYRWYVVRDWKHVYSGKASGVARGASLSPMFQPDELVFRQEVGDTLHRRMPRVAGELSHVLLPETFVLPPDLAGLKAKPLPATLFARASTVRSSIALRPDAEARAPAGFTAYTFVHPTLVLSGIATSISASNATFHLAGSQLSTRRALQLGEASHILVPNDITVWTVPFTAVLEYPPGRRSSLVSPAFRAPHGKAYRFRLNPDRDINGHLIVFELSMEAASPASSPSNLLDLTGKLRGFQKWDFAAGDLAHGPAKSIYGSSRTIDLPNLGLEVQVKVVRVAVEPIPATSSMPADYRFTHLTLKILALPVSSR
jgi:hypothetical protein